MRPYGTAGTSAWRGPSPPPLRQIARPFPHSLPGSWCHSRSLSGPRSLGPEPFVQGLAHARVGGRVGQGLLVAAFAAQELEQIGIPAGFQFRQAP